MKAIKLVVLLILSCLAGYLWFLASLFIFPTFFDRDFDWSKGASSGAEFVLHQAVPGGVIVAVMGASVSVYFCLRKPPQA